jgi:hypothetical protein
MADVHRVMTAALEDLEPGERPSRLDGKLVHLHARDLVSAAGLCVTHARAKAGRQTLPELDGFAALLDQHLRTSPGTVAYDRRQPFQQSAPTTTDLRYARGAFKVAVQACLCASAELGGDGRQACEAAEQAARATTKLLRKSPADLHALLRALKAQLVRAPLRGSARRRRRLPRRLPSSSRLRSTRLCAASSEISCSRKAPPAARSSRCGAENLTAHKVAWTTPVNWNSGYSALPACTGNLVFVTADGVLEAHDASTGMLVWQFQGDGQLWGSIAIAAGYLYVGSNANMYAVDISTQQSVWQGPGGMASIANGLLFVTNRGSSVSAYALTH